MSLVDSPVVILGAGHGGLALSAHLALRGLEVRLYEHPDLAKDFAAIKASATIDVEGTGSLSHQRAKLALASHELDAVLDGAQLVHLVVPVSVQERFYVDLIPRLGLQHTLVIWAGRFGALRCARLRDESSSRFGIVEVNTLPFGSRRTGSCQVAILFRATVLYAASVDELGRPAIVKLQSLFPQVRAVPSPIEAALRNSGMPLLGVGALMNVAAIERRGKNFALFRDGLTPTVRKAIRLTHEEIIAVAHGLGLTIQPYPDEVYDSPTSIEGVNFQDEQGGTEGFMRLTGPDRVNHRYTVENIRYGLAVVSALGKRCGVSTPFIDAICTLADGLCGCEFAQLGWSPIDIGLDSDESLLARL